MLKKLDKLGQKKSVNKIQNIKSLFNRIKIFNSLNFRNSLKYFDIYKNILLYLHKKKLANRLIKIKKISRGAVYKGKKIKKKFLSLTKAYAITDKLLFHGHGYKILHSWRKGKRAGVFNRVKNIKNRKPVKHIHIIPTGFKKLTKPRKSGGFKRRGKYKKKLRGRNNQFSFYRGLWYKCKRIVGNEKSVPYKFKKFIKNRKINYIYDEEGLDRETARKLRKHYRKRFTFLYNNYKLRRLEHRVDWKLIGALRILKRRTQFGEYCGKFLYRIFERRIYYDLFNALQFNRLKYLRKSRSIISPNFLNLKRALGIIKRRKIKVFKRLNRKLRIFYFTGRRKEDSGFFFKKNTLMAQMVRKFKKLKKRRRLSFNKKLRRRKYWFRASKKSTRKFFKIRSRVSKFAMYSNPTIRSRFVFMFLLKKLFSAYTTFKNEENLITSLSWESDKLMNLNKKRIKKLSKLGKVNKKKKNRKDIFYNIFVTVHKGDVLINLVLPRLNKLIARFSVSLLKRSKKKRKNKNVVILRLMKYFIYFLNFLNVKRESLKSGAGRIVLYRLIVRKSLRDFKLKFFLKIFLRHVERLRKRIIRGLEFRTYLFRKSKAFHKRFKVKRIIRYQPQWYKLLVGDERLRRQSKDRGVYKVYAEKVKITFNSNRRFRRNIKYDPYYYRKKYGKKNMRKQQRVKPVYEKRFKQRKYRGKKINNKLV